MKNAVSFLLAVIITIKVFGQVPNTFKYQAVVRNASGAVITNQIVSMRISILHGSTSGTAVCTEVFTPTTNAFGLVNVEIGSVNPVNFTAIDWVLGPYFIKVELDPAGGTDYKEMGISQLLSVPYANYAKKSGNGFSGNYNDLLNKPDLYDSSWISIKGKPDFTKWDKDSTNDITLGDDQTITGVKTFDNNIIASNGLIVKNSGINNSNNYIFNVANPVNNTDAANKDYVDKQLAMVMNAFASSSETFISPTKGILKDTSGNKYNFIKIGSQWWMSENMRTTKYNDGTNIPLVTDSVEWSHLGDNAPAYCWYNNDSITYAKTYGALYTWNTVASGLLCPTGWHVPSETDWNIMINYLGGVEVAGGKLKESGYIHWNPNNDGATNSSGFTALPGGMRDHDQSFQFIGIYAHFWSSTSYVSTNAMYYELGGTLKRVTVSTLGRYYGHSVRCVRDK